MPITLPGSYGVILPSMGMAGSAAPRFALGIATGIVTWVPTISVQTLDTGTAGLGTGVIPLVIPQPALLAAILEAFASQAILGVLGPAFAAGLSLGLFATFSQGTITTTHPSVGTGAGVARLTASPPLVQLQQGLAGQVVLGVGGQRIAAALSTALSTVFNAFTVPVAIIGSASPTASTGVGVGTII